jgi:hypothetical protein
VKLSKSSIGMEETQLAGQTSVHVYPSPFRDHVIFEFKTDNNTSAEIEIYDLQGHLLIRIHEDQINDIGHRAIWNGKTAGQQDLPAGIYLYCIRIGEDVINGKLIRQ